MSLAGDSIGVATLDAADVRPLRRREIAHVREMALVRRSSSRSLLSRGEGGGGVGDQVTMMNENNSGHLVYVSRGETKFEIIGEWYDEIFTWIGKRNLQIYPASRLKVQQELVTDMASNGGRVGQHTVENILTSLVDAYQWRSILNVAERRPTDEQLKNRVQKALKGSIGVSQGGVDQGRDRQFELFTFTSLRDDHSPVLSDDGEGGADITLGSRGIAIEAKRITSKSTFENRFSKAKEQIGKCATVGAFATDLTALIDHRYPPTVNDVSEAGPALARNLRDVMSEQEKRLKNTGAARVWAAHASRFYYVGEYMIGPIGCWAFMGIGDGTEVDEDRVMRAFAHPGSYSFFD